MPRNKVCKTVHQYNKEPVSGEDMAKLQEIARDYGKVKNYVYRQYSGIGSLAKLYPGYTVQNEMTDSGLREKTGLPSVYFYLAVFEALDDIKSQWARTKGKVQQLIGRNEGLTEEEKHYLRFLLKVNNAFTAVLNQTPMVLPGGLQKRLEELASEVDTEKLHRYLCRQVRKYQVKSRSREKPAAESDAGKPMGFSAAERAYRYGEKNGCKGIYISTKENRKRIFISLTDSNQYNRQLYIRLYPEEGKLEIMTAVDVTVRFHQDYVEKIGAAMGMHTMLTTHEGHCYGQELGTLQTEYARWIRQQTGIYNRNRTDNPGRKKYYAQKNRLEERLHSYINQELNRFLKTERPGIIYLVKLPRPGAGGSNKKANHSMTMWQRGYIRKRLEQKCREQSVKIAEVLGKDISRECSKCGEVAGSRNAGIFVCEACGYRVDEKTNTAENVLRRGINGKILY